MAILQRSVSESDYDDLIRMSWDLETEGLDPHIHAISQIGIRTNKGFEKIITIEDEVEGMLQCCIIYEFIHVLKYKLNNEKCDGSKCWACQFT